MLLAATVATQPLIIGLLVGLIVAALIYYVGLHFGAPQPIVGLIALLVFVAIFLSYSGV